MVVGWFWEFLFGDIFIYLVSLLLLELKISKIYKILLEYMVFMWMMVFVLCGSWFIFYLIFVNMIGFYLYIYNNMLVEIDKWNGMMGR